MILKSVETTLGPFRASGSGTLKQERYPVLVLVGVERRENSLACAVASFHAGLVPGVYDLSDGSKVRVPDALVSSRHEHHPHVTLEVPS